MFCAFPLSQSTGYIQTALCDFRKHTVMYQTPRSILVVVQKNLCSAAYLTAGNGKMEPILSTVAIFLDPRICTSYLNHLLMSSLIYCFDISGFQMGITPRVLQQDCFIE